MRPLPQIRLPYQPWVVPFTVNLLDGEIIDWRGSPGTGYQGPDLWGWLGEPEGARVQCDFLRDAQLAWEDDFPAIGRGPVRALLRLGPAGQVRVRRPRAGAVDLHLARPELALGRLPVPPARGDRAAALRARADADYADAIAKARLIVGDYMLWLDQVGWQSLGGAVAGPPTDYNPGDPDRNYEEPHFAAYILRAALWAVASNELTTEAENAARMLISRAWEYLQDLYVTSGPMAGTWSPDPGNQTWYGFWHAEIILTLVLLARPGLRGHRGAARGSISASCARCWSRATRG